MSTFLSILGAFLVLSVLVFVHELGHFMAGRKLGFKILEFALGMGPILVKTEKKGIVYALRAFPIGGMCRFYGEDEEASDALSFNAQKAWKRAIVVAAGPVMNILFAFVFTIITLMAIGDYMPSVLEVDGGDTPAAIAGVMADDIIVSVDDRKIQYYNEAVDVIRAADPDETKLGVLRDGKRLTLTLLDIYDEESGHNIIGITIQPVRVKFGIVDAVGNSASYIWSLIKEMLAFLGSMFTQGVSEGDVVGPVGTITLIGQAVRLGIEVVMRLAVLISLNLAIMNLLPIPALDGGRLVFIAIEAVRGKPISPEKEGMIHFVGIILLFGLMIFLTVKDVIGLF